MKFFKKHRKLIFTVATVMMLCLSMAICCFAADPEEATGFGGVLDDFIDLLVGGIEGMGSGIGSGVNTFVGDLFLTLDSTGNVTGLSLFGSVTAIFAGIALAVGLTTLIFKWIQSIGN